MRLRSCNLLSGQDTDMTNCAALFVTLAVGLLSAATASAQPEPASVATVLARVPEGRAIRVSIAGRRVEGRPLAARADTVVLDVREGGQRY